jgi:hypothetical protein
MGPATKITGMTMYEHKKRMREKTGVAMVQPSTRQKKKAAVLLDYDVPVKRFKIKVVKKKKPKKKKYPVKKKLTARDKAVRARMTAEQRRLALLDELAAHSDNVLTDIDGVVHALDHMKEAKRGFRNKELTERIQNALRMSKTLEKDLIALSVFTEKLADEEEARIYGNEEDKPDLW